MMLVMEDVSFCYHGRKTPALFHISLTVKPGEMVLLAGRSGCGKSTLIKAATGLLGKEHALEGRIFINGRDIRKRSAEEIGLMAGTVYQTPDDQLFAMTVEDEVSFALENRGEPPRRIREAVQWALSLVGLAGFEKRSIHALSGGQRQRLALASVLVTRPGLLILDEPVSQMNPEGVKEFLSLLLRLNKNEGMTILMAEHRVNELASYFPRLCVMDEGRLVYDGEMEKAWTAMEDPGRFGIREPQTVTLGRLLRVKTLSSSVEKTVAAIEEAGIRFAPHVETKKGGHHAPVVLEAEGIRYSYPEAKENALQDVSLSLQKGTINALMGSNGAGKSTLLNVISGLAAADSGTLLWNGYPLKQNYTVGYMRQEADLMLLTDSVEEELTWNNPLVSEEEMDVLLKKLHLSGNRHDFPLALSKGQRLRVVFGSLLARRDTRLLLLDEPTTGQDQASLKDMRFLMRYAARTGRTILFCTHDIELTADIADRVFILSKGRIVFSGSPAEALGDEKRLAQGGLAAPPMLEVARRVGIEPCLTAREVKRHVISPAVGGC